MNERTISVGQTVRVNAQEMQDLITRVVQAEAILRRVECDAQSLKRHDCGGFRTVEVTERTVMECAGFLEKSYTVDDVQRLFQLEAA